jgi:hypothetical protein
MEQAIPGQPAAVVPRSHYTLVRALLGMAVAAIVALSIAVAVLASDDGDTAETNTAKPSHSIEYGGFSPNTGRPGQAPLPGR